MLTAVCLAIAATLADDARCAECHPAIVESYARHGMARTLAPMTPDLAHTLAGAEVADPRARLRFALVADGDGLTFEERGDGPAGFGPHRLARRVVAVVGAGRVDRSFVLEHSGRLFFAPAEWSTSHGLVLAPHQEIGPSSRLWFALQRDCLACHTDRAQDDLFPRNLARGVTFSGIGCAGCHGDTSAHVASGGKRGTLTDLESLPPLRQHDVCARCHLQGDARLELTPSGAAPFAPGDRLFATRAAFVAREAGDDFGFVSHSERLARSACFTRSAGAIRCTTCHDPHSTTATAGFAASDRACVSCHAVDRLSTAAGHDGGADASCSSCHLRKSAPHDLRHVTITDHWIRKSPPPARELDALRVHTAKDGDLVRFRWPVAGEDSGEPEDDGALAMALTHLGLAPRAATLFDTVVAAGVPQALDRLATFHFYRGRAYETVRRTDDAIAAYRTALERAPDDPATLANLGYLLAVRGDPEAKAVLEHASKVAPDAESPWQNLVVVAAMNKDMAAAERALDEALARNPDLPNLWVEKGKIAFSRKQFADADAAFTRASDLVPSLPGIWTRLGQAAYFAGDRKRAKAAFEEALRQQPEDKDAAYGLTLVER